MRKTERGGDQAVPARPINPPAPRDGAPVDPAQERLIRPGEQPGADPRAPDHAESGRVPDAPKADGRHADGQPEQHLFAERDAEHLRQRWHQVQGGFVDDPGHAVEEADKLVVEAMKTLAERKRSLEGWRDSGAGTEDLRHALRDYRAFLDRLLKV